jgi:geranylgeranyl pyrophosphate synthase
LSIVPTQEQRSGTAEDSLAATPRVESPASDQGNSDQGKSRRKTSRRKTSHLKLVPDTRSLREMIRAKAIEVAARLDKSRPLSKDEMEAVARALLSEIQQPEGFLGWTMVTLASAFWRDQVAAVPHSRRLLLLPHCLKHAEGCPADYDEFGLDCRQCGACSIADYRGRAEEMGYKVLVAEGSPIVLKIIVSGHVDAIVGVACLNVLEKAIDKILLAGIPCTAVPLLSSDCRNTSVDEDWVAEMIEEPHVVQTAQTRSYVHLMRTANDMFESQRLDQLAGRQRRPVDLRDLGKPNHGETPSKSAPRPTTEPTAWDPIASTESLALDFLARGGKHSRPFITLAVHDALTGGHATEPNTGAEHAAAIDAAVQRTALSIETFHKASLVHDDIEDGDAFRYGEETLHRRFGTPTAINVGDYLIGLGYRLVSREAGTLGPEAANEILDRLALAHMKLCEGQGAELLWRDARHQTIEPLDALKIYALKTAPAFEAALYAGARLAGPVDTLAEPFTQFSRHLGVAFQILNDLKDWLGDDDNKLSADGDLLAGRPTLLLALAMQGLNAPRRARLQSLVDAESLTSAQIAEARRLYHEAGVFAKAEQLIDKYQQRAEAVADEVQPDELRRLLYYLVDTVLERVDLPEPNVILPTLSLSMSAGPPDPTTAG